RAQFLCERRNASREFAGTTTDFQNHRLGVHPSQFAKQCCPPRRAQLACWRLPAPNLVGLRLPLPPMGPLALLTGLFFHHSFQISNCEPMVKGCWRALKK